jgi:hypothetical protein
MKTLTDDMHRHVKQETIFLVVQSSMSYKSSILYPMSQFMQ